ncbi:MAG: tetratricopeptide repeat protein [Ardenticatenaceae bacterium]
MFEFSIMSLIPDVFFTRALDVTVDVVVKMGQHVLNEEVLRKIRLLRSDRGFRVAFEGALERASDRFVGEYVDQDEDLVEAIVDDEGFFKNQEVQGALLTVLQNPGMYLAEQQAVLAASFDSVLPRRRNRERVRRAVDFFLKCLAKEVWNLPELRPAYAAYFQRMTVDGINQLVAVQKVQLEAQLEANQANLALGSDIRAALLTLTEAMVEQKLLPAPPQSPPIRRTQAGGGGKAEGGSLPILGSAKPLVRHNLPRPDYERFVGRKKELGEVRRLLLPTTRHFVVTIDGVGGIGKSALALEVATGYLRHAEQLPEEERFEAIVWTTAKQSVLTGQGISRRRQALRTLDDIYSTIAITLEREEIIRTRSEEQEELVRRALTQQRVLLIIDNLETVDDERVMNFIREVPDPTKVIVTTRHRVDVAYPIRLEGMSQSEALELIANEAHIKGVRLTKTQAVRLHKRTGGVPLALVWSIAQMGFGYGVSSVLTRLGQPTNDIAKFCFEGAVEGIRDPSTGSGHRTPAHKLLMALSLFAPDASRDALGYVAELPELDRDDGLVALETLSLVNRKDGRFAYLPLTKTFAAAERKRYPEFDQKSSRRWVDYLRNISKRPDSEYYWRYQDYAFYAEGPNILQAVQWSYINGTSEDVFELVLAAQNYLDSKGEWNTALTLIEQALELANSIQKPLAIARLSNPLAWFLQQRGEYETARTLYLDGLHQYRQVGNDEGQAITLHHLALVYRKTKQFEKAKELCDQAWRIAENLAEGDLNALLNTEYGKLARDMQNYPLAWQYFTQVQEWFEQKAEETPSDQVLARATWGQLAIVAYHLGRPQEAKDLCLKSLEFFKSFGAKAFLPTLNYRLALAEAALGEHDAALKHAQHALEWFDRLGMRPDNVEAKRLVEQLTAQTA